MIEKAREMLEDRVTLVMGGFHLSGTSAERIGHIVADLKTLEVERVAPCHCSGDVARKMFQEAYGKHFIPAGVGLRLEMKEAFKSTERKSSSWGEVKRGL